MHVPGALLSESAPWIPGGMNKSSRTTQREFQLLRASGPLATKRCPNTEYRVLPARLPPGPGLERANGGISHLPDLCRGSCHFAWLHNATMPPAFRLKAKALPGACNLRVVSMRDMGAGRQRNRRPSAKKATNSRVYTVSISE